MKLTIGLVAEVKWEVREVCRQLCLQPSRNSHVFSAMLHGNDIRLCLSGMIPSVAKERVTRFLDETKPDMMISSGLAGALQRHIVVGDVIVQSETPALAERAAQALKARHLPFHVGPLVTVAQPVLTPAARRALAAQTNAVGVDMESQTIAALCKERGIPSLALKAVSDGMDDDLSPILGGVEIIRIPRIALKVLCRPGTWPLASRLARHSYRAADHLGHAVWAVISSLLLPAEDKRC
jgi:adenosylhomocysteine nucleosidase